MNWIGPRSRIPNQKSVHCGTFGKSSIKDIRTRFNHISDCVTKGLSLNFSGLQCPLLWNGGNLGCWFTLDSLRFCHRHYCTAGRVGKGGGSPTPGTRAPDPAPSASFCCRHTSGEPILSILPSSSWGNVAMPTHWLLLIIIYECAAQPSDRQFFSFLACGPFPNCHKTDHPVHKGTQ